MATFWTFAFILVFFTSCLCVFIDGSDECICTAPVIMAGGSIVVEGVRTCSNLKSLPRNIFDTTDCDFTKLVVNQTSTAVSFTMANFKAPQASLKQFRLLDICVREIQSEFFQTSRHLSSVLFKNVRCLPILKRRVFYGLERLATIRINGGDLTTIYDEAFSNLQSLTELTIISTNLKNLPNVLVSGTSKLNDIILHSNKISTIPETFFQSNFIGDPIKVDLSNNSIETLPTRLFLNMKLKSLNLENNRLLQLSLKFNSYTFGNIDMILLGNNRLQSLDEQFLNNLTKSPKRTSRVDLDIQGNQWECSCPSEWIKGLGDYVDGLRCHLPNKLKGRFLKTLSPSDLCPPTPKTTSRISGTSMGKGGYTVATESGMKDGAASGKVGKNAGGPPSQEIVAIGVAVGVIVTGLILVFLLYRFRNKICKKSKSSKPHTAEYHAANSKDPENGYNGDPIARETYVVA